MSQQSKRFAFLEGVGAYAIVGLASVILGVGVAREATLLVMAVGGLGCLYVLVKPYQGSLLLVLSAFSLQVLTTTGLIPSSGALIQDGIAIALFAAMVVRAMRAERSKVSVNGSRWLLAFCVFALLGGIVNTAGAGPAALGLRAVIRFVPLLFAPAVFDWSERQARAVVWLVLGLILLQAPVSAAQFVMRSGRSGDPVSGTLGVFASGQLTTIVVAAVTLLAGLYIYRAIPLGWAIAAILLLAIPPALNETKVFFAVAPLVWAIALVPRLGRRWIRVLLLVAMLSLSFALVVQSYSTFYSRSRLTPEGISSSVATQLSEDPGNEGVLRRIPSIAFAWRQIADSPATLLFGFGPGSVTRNWQTGLEGALVQEFGAALGNTTFVVRLMLEYGVLGVVCFTGLLLGAFRVGWMLERRDTDGFWRAAGVGLQGMVVTFGLLSVYTSTFTSDAVSATMWATAGACVLRYHTLVSPTEREDVTAVSEAVA